MGGPHPLLYPNPHMAAVFATCLCCWSLTHRAQKDLRRSGVELLKWILKYGLHFHFWLLAKFGHRHVFLVPKEEKGSCGQLSVRSRKPSFFGYSCFLTECSAASPFVSLVFKHHAVPSPRASGLGGKATSHQKSQTRGSALWEHMV